MTFPINPADAQAIQEDEAQLIAAIAQTSMGMATLAYRSAASTPVEQTNPSDRVEHIVKDFLLNHAQASVWDKEGGTYRLEMGTSWLQITDKQDGRGIIFQRDKGDVFSKLTSEDVAHFEQLASRMQTVEQQARMAQQATDPKPETDLELD